MTSFAKALSTFITVFLGIIIIAAIIAISIGWIGKPIKYEIAESFNGWATVVYKNPTCKPPKEEGLFFVIEVDESGKGCTSSLIPQGWRYAKFVRVNKDGIKTKLSRSSWGDKKSRMIWAGAVISPQGGYSYTGEIFFVGTAEQLEKAWSKQPIPK